MLQLLWLILAASGALLGVLAPPGDDVDFAAPPHPGLLYSRLRTIESSLAGRRLVDATGDPRVQILRQKLIYTEDYTEKILEVKEGRVVALTRKYVRADTDAEVETDRMTRPRKDFREEPFAAVDLFVAWKDGKADLRVIVSPDERMETDDPDTLSLARPSDAMAEALADAFEHPHPLLPRGPATRRVGSRWTVDEDAINRLFARKPADRVHGSLEVTFASIREDCPIVVSTVVVGLNQLVREATVEETAQVPIRGAVLEVKGTLWTAPEEGLPLEIALEGSLVYSIEHRLVVQARLAGRQTVKGTAQGDRFAFEGPYLDTIKVELHREKVAPREEPDAQPAGEPR